MVSKVVSETIINCTMAVAILEVKGTFPSLFILIVKFKFLYGTRTVLFTGKASQAAGQIVCLSGSSFFEISKGACLELVEMEPRIPDCFDVGR